MAYWRKVDCRMWADQKFRALTDDAKLLWVWLLTGPQTTSLPGLYAMGKAAAAEAMGWPVPKLERAWTELGQMAIADWAARVVWLPNAIKYQWPLSYKNVIGWRPYMDAIPECSLKLRAWHGIRNAMERLQQETGKCLDLLDVYDKTLPMPHPMGDGIPHPMAHGIIGEGEGEGEGEKEERERRILSSEVEAPSDVSAVGIIPDKDIDRVYHHYLQVMGKTPQTYRLTPKRRTKIRTRLREYTVAALCAAIDACARSDFHMGRNKSSRPFNDLADHVLVSHEKVEQWVYGGQR